jgi:PmbA protein
MEDYQQVLNRLSQQGYQAEILVVDTDEMELEVDQDRSIASIGEQSASYQLRVVKDHRLGTSVSNSFDNSLVERALQVARLSASEKCNCLPGVACVGNTEANFKFKLEDSIEKVGKAVFDLLGVPGWSVSGGIAKAGNYRKTVMNTEGVHVEERRSALSISFGIYTDDGTGSSPDVWDGRSSTSLNVDLRGMIDALSAKKEIFRTITKNDRKYPEVALTSLAATEVLGNILPSEFWGASLYWQSTPLVPGLDVRNPNLSIREDPFIEYSIDSRVYDVEGQKRFPVSLMRAGVIEGFLYDTYWAHKAGVKSTASAGGACNLVIDAREDKDVLQDVLVIDNLQGIDGIDAATGRFSMNAEIAWRNFNGRPEAVRGVVVSGDMISLLRGIQATSAQKISNEAVISGDLRIRGKGLSIG